MFVVVDMVVVVVVVNAGSGLACLDRSGSDNNSDDEYDKTKEDVALVCGLGQNQSSHRMLLLLLVVVVVVRLLWFLL